LVATLEAPAVTEKACTKCGLVQDLECFYTSKAGKHGHQSWCKRCMRQYYLAQKLAFPEKYRADIIAARAAHPRRDSVNSRAWRDANPGKDRASSKAWREAHPERQYETHRAWHLANPEKSRTYTQARRGMKLDLFVEHVYIAVLMERDCRICGICGLQIVRDHPDRMYRSSVDHIIPLSKGGLHSYANTQPAHLVCNLRKGVKILDPV